MTLKKGDVLYCEAKWPKRIERLVLNRETAKRVYFDNLDFDKEQLGEPIYSRGSHGWDRAAYYLETPKWKDRHHRFILEYKFGKIEVEKLTTEQLAKINAIVRKESTNGN